jgi:hypothetical protein
MEIVRTIAAIVSAVALVLIGISWTPKIENIVESLREIQKKLK